MRIGRLTSRQRRTLALGMLAAVLLLVYAATIQPVISKYVSYRNVIQNSLFQIDRLQHSVADIPALEARLEQLRQQTGTAERYLQHGTPALAAADLQQKTGRIVSAAGGRLVSSQVVRHSGEDGNTGVALRVRLSGDSQVLRQVLHTIESSEEPFLFVDNLDIRSTQARPGRSQPPDSSENLTVIFDLIGYLPG